MSRFVPLSGIRVIDLTTSVAGPYCTLLLGAMGADVIKVERPGIGDDTRHWGPPFWKQESAMFLSMNANKRSLAVDLKTDRGREFVLALTASADVFVENLRPGAAERLGLGVEQVAEVQPNIIYCSISAFGSTGPRAQEPGYDPLMQAAAGIMSVTGEADGEPVRAGVSLVDQGTGLWCVVAILAALRRQDAGEPGPALIQTSLFEVALNWVPYHVVGYLATGASPSAAGSAMAMLAPYQAFATRNGRMMIAAGNDRLFAALCNTLKRPELAHDDRFSSNPARVANRETLTEEIERALAGAGTEDWLATLTAAGIPCAAINDIGSAVNDAQTKAIGALQPLPHPAISDLKLVVPPIRVDGTHVAHRTPPARVGEHTAEILGEIGVDASELERLARAGIVST